MPAAESPLAGRPPEEHAAWRALLARRLHDRATRDAIPRRGSSGPAVLSLSQQRLWWFERAHAGRAVYNRPTVLRLAGALDVEALERSLAEVVRRHEVLRTTYPERGGVPVQEVGPAAPLRLAVVDLRSLPPAARSERARGMAAEEGSRPFDLVLGPVFRAVLVALGAD
ncbi:MAG TPA: condensation domain-containing protein, partial [Longimicrobiaceae bacterium]|nr:condensation domain-containing protein [Longimicrobiaceae bacterium]